MSSGTPPAAGDDGTRGILKSSSNLAAGLFLLLLAAVGFFGSLPLRFGTLSQIGPGLMPRAVSILVAAFGLLLVVEAFITHGPKIERWSFRGPFFILGSIVLFALTIRGMGPVPALGLIGAGPLAMIFSAFASDETKIQEIIPYALVLTAICYVMFKLILRLPIPVMPVLLGY